MYDKQLFLRNARSDELDSVSLLIRDANEQYESLLPPEAWKFYVDDMMDVRARLNESELIVAELDGQLVGTVTLYLGVGHSIPARVVQGMGRRPFAGCSSRVSRARYWSCVDEGVCSSMSQSRCCHYWLAHYRNDGRRTAHVRKNGVRPSA